MENLRERVEAALEEILPRMVTDGGGAHILGVEGDEVTLELCGSCKNCPSRERSARALKQGIMARESSVKSVRVINSGVLGRTEVL